MSMIDAGFLPLKRYADFRGRSTRTELVMFWLLTVMVTVVLNFGMLLSDDAPALTSTALGLVLLCPSFALSVRRLHDQGRRGWWALLALTPIAAGFWHLYHVLEYGPFYALEHRGPAWLGLIVQLPSLALLVFLLLPGEEGANRYGGNPRSDPEVPY